MFLKPVGRSRVGAIAAAALLVGSLAWLPAHALSLGRITVQSALGEPLRAEIDVSDISPQEAASLNARVGSAEAYRAAGLEFSQLLAGAEISLQRRPDGRSFLRLRGNRPITEPFLDLLIQTSAASGSLSRDYAILLDPPTTRSTAAASAVAAAPLAPSAPAVGRPSAPGPRAAEPARVAGALPAPPVAPAGPMASSGERQLTVKPGETAGKIATQNKPEGVSLDQMLVAMQRSNPDAFIGGNINRIKSGAVINLPGAEAASATAPAEARQSIVAQSKDFNAFRRNFAQNVPAAQVAGADRVAGGGVTAKVEDRAAATPTPDKLTLSKGAVQSNPGATPEETIARNRQSSESSARVAELSKNIADLNKLGLTPGPAAAGAAGATGGATAKVPGVAVPAPSIAGAVTAPVAAIAPMPGVNGAPTIPAASAAGTMASVTGNATAVAAASVASPVAPLTAAAQSASAPALQTSAPMIASVPAAQAKAAVPAPIAPNFVDSLLDNPLILPLGAGLLALIAGFGIYRLSRRKQDASVDSSFLDSRLQPDSFFGASGGQRIDTKESETGSSLVYSPSQLDAAGDVDPVAEADVYLAYGRDLQAEEILKEALRATPARTALHVKLCEIHAKRRDVKSFAAIAEKAHGLTKGTGSEWSLISDMGRELDPTNPQYQSAAKPPVKADGAGTVPVAAQAAPSVAAIIAAKPPFNEVDFDLDLDLDPSSDSFDLHSPSVSTAPSPRTAAPPAPLPSFAALPDLDLDFGTAPGAANALTPAGSAQPDYLRTLPENPVSVPEAKVSAPNSGMLEFDLDCLSLDLGAPSSLNSPDAGRDSGPRGTLALESPLDTKFSLAEEFRSLGDADGARSLAQEVVAEAQGPLKAKAQAFLNTLV